MTVQVQASYQRQQELRLIRIKELMRITGLGRSMVYHKMNINSKYYDSRFPSRIKIGVNAVGWLLSDVMEWVESLK